MAEQLTKRKLQNIAQRLGERDMEILHALERHRYMSTHHLKRLYFTNCLGELAALRRCNRTLAKLREYGVIACLNRRIGGVRAGSGAFVWTLTAGGAKLISMRNGCNEAMRKRVYEPSTAFLTHTLAVTETIVRLHEMNAKGKLFLTDVKNEPDCWRKYSGMSGEVKTLKPDLCAVTAIGEFEDSWFFELDLNSEAPCIVIRKCLQYCAYYRTGIEQRLTGVFPSVIWIVLDEKRRLSLTEHLQRNIAPNERGLFCIIIMSELEPLLKLGVEKYTQERATI